MYSDLKQRILPLIYDVTSPTGIEIIKILDEYEKKMKGAVCWAPEDMIHMAKTEGWELSEDDAQEALEEMIDEHDCSVGITWETVSFYIDKYRQ